MRKKRAKKPAPQDLPKNPAEEVDQNPRAQKEPSPAKSRAEEPPLSLHTWESLRVFLESAGIPLSHEVAQGLRKGIVDLDGFRDCLEGYLAASRFRNSPKWHRQAMKLHKSLSKVLALFQFRFRPGRPWSERDQQRLLALAEEASAEAYALDAVQRTLGHQPMGQQQSSKQATTSSNWIEHEGQDAEFPALGSVLKKMLSEAWKNQPDYAKLVEDFEQARSRTSKDRALHRFREIGLVKKHSQKNCYRVFKKPLPDEERDA